MNIKKHNIADLKLIRKIPVSRNIESIKEVINCRKLLIATTHISI